MRLSDRVYEVDRLAADLKRSLNQVKDEISKLDYAKDVTERELEARQAPINTALRCLALRERRREGDLVKDFVERELEKEVETLQKSRSLLEKAVLDAIARLRVLHEAKQNLEDDIRDKDAAFFIDNRQHEVTEASPDISYKPSPTRIPKDTIYPSSWLEHSISNMSAAECTIKDSQKLRDFMCVTIQNVSREDRTQAESANFALRKRLHNESRAREELQWQKDQLLSEIRLQENEINRLEDLLLVSNLPLKVAQTRLEERTARVRHELVRDAPQEGLTDEVNSLTHSRNLFRENLAAAKEALHVLQRQLRAVDVDLGRKCLSVSLEKKVEDVRRSLEDQKCPETLTEANLKLTASLRNHPTQIL